MVATSLQVLPVVVPHGSAHSPSPRPSRELVRSSSTTPRDVHSTVATAATRALLAPMDARSGVSWSTGETDSAGNSGGGTTRRSMDAASGVTSGIWLFDDPALSGMPASRSCAGALLMVDGLTVLPAALQALSKQLVAMGLGSAPTALHVAITGECDVVGRGSQQ